MVNLSAKEFKTLYSAASAKISKVQNTEPNAESIEGYTEFALMPSDNPKESKLQKIYLRITEIESIQPIS